MSYSVYILKCSDDRLYIGCTSDLKSRLERHKKGYVPATKSRRPFDLQIVLSFRNKPTAYAFEKYLKSGAGRLFIKKRLLPPGGVA